MPRQSKTYHYIYKTTCLVTGRFYVGMHSTDNLEDGYLGSGKRLGYSRKKHGDAQHIKVIIEMLPSREALKTREKELVNSDLLKHPQCMNLQEGGGGGFAGEEHRNSFINSSRTARLRGTGKAKEIAKKAHETMRLRGTFVKPPRTKGTLGLKFKKTPGSAVGERNSQYGTCWVSNGTAVKIRKEQLDQYLADGYRRGRK